MILEELGDDSPYQLAGLFIDINEDVDLLPYCEANRILVRIMQRNMTKVVCETIHVKISGQGLSLPLTVLFARRIDLWQVNTAKETAEDATTLIVS